MSGHGLRDLFGFWPAPEDDPDLPALTPLQRAALRRAPGWKSLTADERARLERLTRTFLKEKDFEGCGGLTLTDSMRATIAGQACVLLLGMDAPVYPGLRSVLVYPDSFKSPCRARGDDGIVLEGARGLRGETTRGVIVLAWRNVRRGGPPKEPGMNLVLHEFAHQLARETGAVDGIPELRDGARDRAWRRTLKDAHARLRADLERGAPTFLRAYAATDTHEFFAVLTEAFFETPVALRDAAAHLYELMRDLYRQDPAAR